MAELLLELFSEEIPARMQARAAEDLKRLVTDKLKEARLDFDTARAFATPRRLALVVDGLPLRQPDLREERKGPRVGAPEPAIQGFLKSTGLDSLDQCEVREVKGIDFYFVVQHKEGGSVQRVLVDALRHVAWSFPWPKSMRWADGRASYVRPLHNIVLLFNGQLVEFMAGGIPTEGSLTIPVVNKTVGHRFLAPETFEVSDFADYRKKLRDAYVILDPAERREIIWRQATELAAAAGLTVKEDRALLDEVAGLVEWPVVLMGRIDEAFMGVPPEVLTTTMRANQKYFTLLHPDGTMAPRFGSPTPSSSGTTTARPSWSTACRCWRRSSSTPGSARWPRR
jgi:glycyl-tRNA synthetase beta chain